MINQYFNVYALRRVRCAGYATDKDLISYCYAFENLENICILKTPIFGMVD